jgi:hypothetical protein
MLQAEGGPSVGGRGPALGRRARAHARRAAGADPLDRADHDGNGGRSRAVRPPAADRSHRPHATDRPAPVLLIRGTEGNDDESLNRIYHDAGGPTTSLWEIPRAGHAAGIAAAPAEYERRVIGFFDYALLAGV